MKKSESEPNYLCIKFPNNLKINQGVYPSFCTNPSFIKKNQI